MSSVVSAGVVEVLYVNFDRVVPGSGEARQVTQYWSKDGRLLAEHDSFFHSPDVAIFEVQRLQADCDRLRAEVARQVVHQQEGL